MAAAVMRQTTSQHELGMLTSSTEKDSKRKKRLFSYVVSFCSSSVRSPEGSRHCGIKLLHCLKVNSVRSKSTQLEMSIYKTNVVEPVRD